MKISNSIKITKLLALLFISTLTFTACSNNDDNDEPENEEELITTVNYTLTNGNNEIVLTFSDPDGEGGNDGTYTVSDVLAANTTYIGEIELLNESESPAEDITEEVKAEDDEHEFFYSSSVSSIEINKTDTDENGNPVGIETTLTTGFAGSGTLTIILKHEPTKPNNNTTTDAGGSTDVEVTFNIEVQ